MGSSVDATDWLPRETGDGFEAAVLMENRELVMPGSHGDKEIDRAA
ncbi:hypothetical protein ACWCXB_03205 [Streptomyces sp. NPDC001514]